MISQRIRKRVEEIFGWMKTVGNFRKTRYVGLGANQIVAHVLASAYNLMRIAKLTGQHDQPPAPRMAAALWTPVAGVTSPREIDRLPARTRISAPC